MIRTYTAIDGRPGLTAEQILAEVEADLDINDGTSCDDGCINECQFQHVLAAALRRLVVVDIDEDAT